MWRKVNTAPFSSGITLVNIGTTPILGKGKQEELKRKPQTKEKTDTCLTFMR